MQVSVTGHHVDLTPALREYMESKIAKLERHFDNMTDIYENGDPVQKLPHSLNISFSFVEERWERELAGNADPIRVLNPIAAPLSVMRSSLMGSLVATLRHNLARRAPRVRVFELGRVYQRDPQAEDGEVTVAGVQQPMRAGALAYGAADELQWAQPERSVDFYDLKGDLESLLAPRHARFVPASHPALHPGRSARVQVDGRSIGWIGELHPRWRQAYELPQAPVLFEVELDALLERDVAAAQPLPRQQSALRDLALVVRDGVSHDALVAAAMDDASGLLRSVRLFDLYKPKAAAAGIGAEERSMALRLEFRDDEATLTDERIEAALAAVQERLADRLQARVRA